MLSWRNDVLAMLADIRRRRDTHPELQRAHNFVFGLPFNANVESFDYMLIGRTPGETEENEKLHPSPTEETIEYNWMDHTDRPETKRTRSSFRWRNEVVKHLPNGGIMQTELFFWSVPDTSDRVFEGRFGTRFHRSPHLDFCRDLNLRLLDLIRPRVVIVVGVSGADKLARRYGLRSSSPITRDERQHALVKPFHGHGVPWLFVKHWTRGHGYSSDHSKVVQSVIERARIDA